MGMYTHVRGWINVDLSDNLDLYGSSHDAHDKFRDIMKRAENISPRSSQCVFSTTFNVGFNFECYIFIGGEVKDYDNDWKTYLQFLKSNFKINEMRLEMKYEEYDEWDILESIE